jgi:plasmid stabilization system protein ParE
MGLRVRLHARARADLRDIHHYLLHHANPRSAERVRHHLLHRMAQLSDFPLSGQSADRPGVRVLNATRYPYRIYYVVRSKEVVILHIRHTARQSPDDVGT